jgi:cobalt/nickel transport system permease protein
MAHIHLEDGSFSLFWVLIWWAAALVLVGISLFLLRSRTTDRRRVTLAAFCAAAAFALFQVSIPIFGGVHINLTPLIGILAGPVLGSLVMLVVNILSAAIGHGGWGLIGANTVVNIIEVASGYAIFTGLARIVPPLFPRGFVAALAGLTLGNIAMIAIIVVSGIQVLTGLSLLATVNVVEAVIEAFITGLVVAYIGKVRPDILGAGKRR